MAKNEKRPVKSVPKPSKSATAPEKADVAVAHAVAPYRETPLVRAVSTFSKLGDQPPMLAISGAVLGAGLLRRDRRMARAGVRMIAAHLLATAAKNFIKRRVDRTRPNVLVQEGRYEMTPGDKKARADTSFPSGHSAGAVAVGRAFARDYPEYAIAANLAAATIALAQIPRCTHYPTDVGAGSAIGFASEAIVSRVMALAEQSDAAERAAS